MNPQSTQERARIDAGTQCPECFGPNVVALYGKFIARPDRFECRDCGCTWHPKFNFRAA